MSLCFRCGMAHSPSCYELENITRLPEDTVTFVSGTDGTGCKEHNPYTCPMEPHTHPDVPYETEQDPNTGLYLPYDDPPPPGFTSWTEAFAWTLNQLSPNDDTALLERMWLLPCKEA